jgi:hypothetical protein
MILSNRNNRDLIYFDYFKMFAFRKPNNLTIDKYNEYNLLFNILSDNNNSLCLNKSLATLSFKQTCKEHIHYNLMKYDNHLDILYPTLELCYHHKDSETYCYKKYYQFMKKIGLQKYYVNTYSNDTEALQKERQYLDYYVEDDVLIYNKSDIKIGILINMDKYSKKHDINNWKTYFNPLDNLTKIYHVNNHKKYRNHGVISNGNYNKRNINNIITKEKLDLIINYDCKEQALLDKINIPIVAINHELGDYIILSYSNKNNIFNDKNNIFVNLNYKNVFDEKAQITQLKIYKLILIRHYKHKETFF